ncbi:hypothetical protein [Thiomonas sp.]
MALGTKAAMILSALKQSGDWKTHDELYKQSPILQREFATPLLLSRRLSDLYGNGQYLDRKRVEGPGQRLQYAYKAKEVEVGIRPAREAPVSPAPASTGAPLSRMAALRQRAGVEIPTSGGHPTLEFAPEPAVARAAPEIPAKGPTVLPPPAAATPKPVRKPVAPARASEAREARPAAAAIPESPTETGAPSVLDWDSWPQPKPASENPLVDLFTDLFSGLFVQVIRQTGPALREALFRASSSPEVKEAIAEVLQTPIDHAPEEAAPEPEPSAPTVPREAMPKVLIVGLLNQQADQIRKQFGERLDLRFWAADRPNPQLQALLDSADVVVGATKFITHSIDGALTRSKNYIRMHGGVSRLRLQLKELLDSHPALA